MKKEVATVAKDALTKVCAAIGNSDIEPFIPAVVSAIANPTEVPDCVYKLAGTTFVQVFRLLQVSEGTPEPQKIEDFRVFCRFNNFSWFFGGFGETGEPSPRSQWREFWGQQHLGRPIF